MSGRIFIEGSGPSKEEVLRCRAAFSELFQKAGITARKPKLLPCGGRQQAFDDFRNALGKTEKNEFVGLMVDSEDPVHDLEKTWQHLLKRDKWPQPAGTSDEQVLLMTTTMETWIAFDRGTLRDHYGKCLQESALPPAFGIENRARATVFKELTHATRNCKGPYEKGDKSFVCSPGWTPPSSANYPVSPESSASSKPASKPPHSPANTLLKNSVSPRYFSVKLLTGESDAATMRS